MAADIKFIPRWFTVTIPVYPAIPMVQENALALAVQLGQKLALTDIHMGEEIWEYRRPRATGEQPKGMVTVEVKKNSVKVEHRYPATGLEQFERLVQQIVNSVPEAFAPQFVFAINIELEYVVDLGSDARECLLDGLGLLDPGAAEQPKIAPFSRPCHLVGLRLGFPPYATDRGTRIAGPQSTDGGEAEPAELADSPEVQAQTGEDWHAIVTMTTLEEDPSKISVEIDGTWAGAGGGQPFEWAEIHASIQEKMGVAETFLRDRVSEFIQHFRNSGNGDENN